MTAATGAESLPADPSHRRVREIAEQFFAVREPAAIDALLRDLELVRVPGGSCPFRENDRGVARVPRVKRRVIEGNRIVEPRSQ